MANYRGISLSPVISKLFKVCLSSKYGTFLTSHNLQFGFKKNSSCASAIFVAQQVIQHFNKNGSTVYLSALDTSKAFDRVDHNMLIKKLVSRGAPWCFIRIIKKWYKLKFRWDQFPRNFPVANVTRKSATSYGEVGRVGRVASLSRGSYGEVNDFQTISTCRDGLATSLTSP